MNFISTRDFVDDLDSELDNALNNESKIHISVKQRTTRKKNTLPPSRRLIFQKSSKIQIYFGE